MSRVDVRTSAWRDLDHAAFGDGSVSRAQIRGTNDDDLLEGTRKGDTIEGRGGDDVIESRLGDDVLSGGNGDDVLNGGYGSDSVYGGAGHDFLRGGLNGGSDHLDGGSGNDRLVGGSDDDELIGGEGKDRFIFNRVSDSIVDRSDTIDDFEQGRDTLSFRNQFRGSDTLHFIGDAPFSHSYGEVRFEILSGTHQTAVSVDLHGNGQADFYLILDGEIALKAGDFSF